MCLRLLWAGRFRIGPGWAQMEFGLVGLGWVGLVGFSTQLASSSCSEASLGNLRCQPRWAAEAACGQSPRPPPLPPGFLRTIQFFSSANAPEILRSTRKEAPSTFSIMPGAARRAEAWRRWGLQRDAAQLDVGGWEGLRQWHFFCSAFAVMQPPCARRCSIKLALAFPLLHFRVRNLREACAKTLEIAI